MSQIHSIQTLAQEVLNHLEHGTRDGGESYIYLKSAKAGWQQDLVQDAHNDMMPDDFKYLFVWDVLNNIVDHEDGTPLCTFQDLLNEWADSDIDVYTHDLIKWMGSNLTRLGYCDDAAKDWGLEASVLMSARMMHGQRMERLEVYQSVLSSLDDQLTELEG